MKRKILSLLIAGTVLGSVLAGCATNTAAPAASTPAETEEAPAEEAETPVEAEVPAEEESQAEVLLDVNGAPTTQEAIDAIEERKASGNYPKLILGFMNFAGTPAGIDRISQRISERTEETLGIDVELMILDAASYGQQMNLILASGEQMDIFNAIRPGFMPALNSGYLLDFDEDNMFELYGQGIKSVLAEKYLDACRVDGDLYGVTGMKEMGQGLFGISIAKQYLDEIGYDYEALRANPEDEIIYTDLDTISDIFAQLHEAFPDKTVFMTDKGTVVSQCLPVDAIGDNFGVLLDPANSLEVGDLFSSDVYMDVCKQMYAWNKAGYFSKDAITDTTGTTPAVKAGTLMAYKTAIKPGIVTQESNLCGMPMILFQCCIDFADSSKGNRMPWCINQNTEDPVAALQLLNAFYTDPLLASLICWGEEGVEYVKTEDGHLTFPEGVDASNSEYYNNVNWELPNQFIAGVWEGESLDVWDRTASFNEQCVASLANGFVFDSSNVSAEYSALTNVYEEYRDQIELGFADPETAIPEMIDRLKKAGLDDYIAEKQAQLDAWAAAE